MLTADLTAKGFKLITRDDTRSVAVLREGRYQMIERTGLRMFAVSPTHGCSAVSDDLNIVIASARDVARYINWEHRRAAQKVAK